jgi:chaperonin cofactor prefoldin
MFLQKDKEDLEEIVTELEELELMDEDSKVP